MPRPSAPGVEPKVRFGTPMPPGYIFVPKGNVYVTSNCRRRTQGSQRTVYTVVSADAKATPLGIRVPREVARVVHEAEAATREDRARAVSRHDESLERQFRDVVKREFPRAPPAEIPSIIKRAMLKGSKRVGRTGTLNIVDKARLAVRAHIRHQHTDYDNLLKQRIKQPQARQLTLGKIGEVVEAWGGQVLPSKQQGKRKGRSQGKRTKSQAKGAPTAQGKKAPATQKPGSSANRTQAQATRAAVRKQNKGRKRLQQLTQPARENTATASATLPQARPSTRAMPVTWATPTTWNWAPPTMWATPADSATSATWVTRTTWNWAPPEEGTAAAPIVLDDDESDEYAWPETDVDDYDSDVAEDTDDYDSHTMDDEYDYESNTAVDDDDIDWSS